MASTSLFFRDEDELTLPIGGEKLYAFQRVPKGASGLVTIAHGSGSSRYSPRDQWIASQLYEQGLGVFLMDLLTREEEAVDRVTRELRFDIPFLAKRLIEVTRWQRAQKASADLKLGLFGASTGAAAALVAAADLGENIAAVVSRGGRPDLAGPALARVSAATLLIVGGDDLEVITLNEEAYAQLHCVKELQIVPGATHLFEEPGKLEQVAALTTTWFLKYL